MRPEALKRGAKLPIRAAMPSLRSVPRGTRTLMPALALLLALATAPAAHAGTSPTIKSISPLKAAIGDKLTITGTGFIPGKQKDIVVFKRDGKPAVFVKADSATSTKIVVTVADKLIPFLNDSGGSPQVQTFRLRVLAKRLGVAFTAKSQSPQIGPAGSGGAVPGCKPQINSDTVDSDNDGLSDALEHKIGTDPCRMDTDGDGIPDGYEYESALDLNNRALPYPGKRPYPNPLDGTDANVDYDGDGLTMADEYALWMYTTGGKFPLTYSDGTQDTGGPTLVTPDTQALDLNGDGILEDGEKDADGDGLSNWDELHGRMTPGWWAATFSGETPFYGAAGTQVMSGVSATDPDSNGDGVPDGQDDQDHDGFTNLQELDRHTAIFGSSNLWVNPYNPCLPDPHSRTCTMHPPISAPWAPFPLPKNATFPLTTTDLGPVGDFLPQP